MCIAFASGVVDDLLNEQCQQTMVCFVSGNDAQVSSFPIHNNMWQKHMVSRVTLV